MSPLSQTPLAPAADQAGGLLWLLWIFVAVCGLIYLLVLGFLVWSLRRRRSKGDDDPVVVSNDTRLSRGLRAWVATSGTVLVALVAASFIAERAIAVDAADPLLVRVTGEQFWWRIEVRDPASGAWVETANELHLPVDTPVRIELRTADVIHSFWVPGLSGKQDMIPGQVNAIDVTPRQVGWLRGQCAEFCGVQHARMALEVSVDTPDAFAAWLAGQQRTAAAPADPAAARGMALVTQGACAACHAVRGTAAVGRAGPDLTHVASRRFLAAGTVPTSRGGLQGWVAQPQALKPGTLMPTVSLSGPDADAIARYLETLR